MKWIVLTLLGSLWASSAMAQTSLVNESFESNNITLYPNYLYAADGVSAQGWTFESGAGISANATEWYGQTDEGNYFAFLQNSSVVKQLFTVDTAADLTFSFNLAQRSAYNNGGAQTIAVLFDDTVVGSFTPYANTGWDQWANYSVATRNVAAGQHLISFVGTNPNNAPDTAVFLDKVGLSVSPVPEPETYAMLLAGVGLMGCLKRRKLRLHHSA